MKVSDWLANQLQNSLVTEVYSFPSGCSMSLDFSLDKAQIRRVVMATDVSVLHACNGAFQASGKIQVGLVGAGPGATNLLTGLATSKADNIPIVAIVSNIKSNQQSLGGFQDFPLQSSLKPAAKAYLKPASACEVPAAIFKAFELAQSSTDRPGPVVVEVAADFWDEQTEIDLTQSLSINRYSPRTFLSEMIEDSPISTEIFQSRELFDIAVVGNGLHKYLTTQSLNNHIVVSSDNFGCMGFALPGAIGACTARPEMRSILFIGDGDFNLSLVDLQVVGELCPNLTIVIFNNSGFGSINQIRNIHSKKIDYLSNPSYSLLAELYGIRGFVCTKNELSSQLGTAIEPRIASIIDYQLEEYSFTKIDLMRQKLGACSNVYIGEDRRRYRSNKFTGVDRRLKVVG